MGPELSFQTTKCPQSQVHPALPNYPGFLGNRSCSPNTVNIQGKDVDPPDFAGAVVVMQCLPVRLNWH